MTEELKPCPFCGGDAVYDPPHQNVGDYVHEVGCETIGCMVLPKVVHLDEYAARQAWNTRTSPKVKPLEWDALDVDEFGVAFVAVGFNITYEAGLDADGIAYWREHMCVDKPIVEVDGSYTHAMSDAQADYERRILSTLE